MKNKLSRCRRSRGNPLFRVCLTLTAHEGWASSFLKLCRAPWATVNVQQEKYEDRIHCLSKPLLHYFAGWLFQVSPPGSVNVLISLNSRNLMIWVYCYLQFTEAETGSEMSCVMHRVTQLLSERTREPGQPDNRTLFSFFFKNQFY